MKTTLKITAGLILFLIVICAGLALFIGQMDINKYRPLLVQNLSEKTGRKVSLSGPISFSLGFDGVHIAIRDASFGNPAWASRPNLASMGLLDITVDLLPLLDHQIDIQNLAIANADILLETNDSGQSNAVLEKPKTAAQIPPMGSPSSSRPQPTAAPMALNIGQVVITDSQIGMRGKEGKSSLYRVQKLVLEQKAAGLDINFIGQVNNEVVNADIKTGITDVLSRKAFPFSADIGYGPFHLTMTGHADSQNSTATIDTYKVSSAATTITGNAAVAWGGVRPLLHGVLNSDHLNVADFALKQTGIQTSDALKTPPAATAPKAPNTRMFSDTPLPLEGLKAVDADFQIKIGEFIQGQSALKNLAATLKLSTGSLVIAPIQAFVADSPVNVELRLNAAAHPAQVALYVSTKDMDLGELQKLADMQPFMSGKAAATLQFSGIGNSPHTIMSTLVGVITVTAAKGEIIGNAVSGISSALAAIFSPQGQDSTINCLGARFIVRGGVMSDNGILLDSAASAVAAKGNVNLGNETVDMTLYAKTKLVDVGGLVPPLLISGPLSDPHYKVDAVGTVKNLIGGLAGNLASGNLSLGNGAVPDLQPAPAGQNACIYTLDHPKNAAASGVLPADAVGKASGAIQNIGNSLVKGFFGQ